MTTLGYKKTCDWVVNSIYNKQRVVNNNIIIRDGRGRAPNPKKISREKICEHIMSFNPSVSHYRREHAPNRLYLPSDVTVVSMYQDFCEKYPDIQCSYDLYRKEIKRKNISFTKLGNEECERCEEYSIHDKAHTKDNFEASCDVCKLWKSHLKYAKESRLAYQKDVEVFTRSSNGNSNTVAISADLQKVIMLPRIDCFKKVLFTKRITAYNESFVGLGKQSKQKPTAVIWHEATAGRNHEEIISAFHVFLTANRDANSFLLWTDNCTGQAKNWAFISFLIYIINSEEIETGQIHMKYFEPGHSFMSADSFHHQVELSMKKQKKTYDFADFIDAVENANNKKSIAKPLNFTDIREWKNCTSLSKINRLDPRPYIRNISEIIFKRNHLTMIYRTFSDKTFHEVDILQNKYKKTLI